MLSTWKITGIIEKLLCMSCCPKQILSIYHSIYQMQKTLIRTTTNQRCLNLSLQLYKQQMWVSKMCLATGKTFKRIKVAFDANKICVLQMNNCKFINLFHIPWTWQRLKDSIRKHKTAFKVSIWTVSKWNNMWIGLCWTNSSVIFNSAPWIMGLLTYFGLRR